MKWSDDQLSQLRDLAFAEVPNPEIARRMGIDTKDVYAKRSDLGITIPKVRAAKGQPAITVKPEFEKAVQEAEKSLPQIHRRLPDGVREAFKRLQDELLLAMARNGTSLEDAKRYGATADIVTLAQNALGRWIQEAE